MLSTLPHELVLLIINVLDYQNDRYHIASTYRRLYNLILQCVLPVYLQSAAARLAFAPRGTTRPDAGGFTHDNLHTYHRAHSVKPFQRPFLNPPSFSYLPLHNSSK